MMKAPISDEQNQIPLRWILQFVVGVESYAKLKITIKVSNEPLKLKEIMCLIQKLMKNTDIIINCFKLILIWSSFRNFLQNADQKLEMF